VIPTATMSTIEAMTEITASQFTGEAAPWPRGETQ
jgi:hypothetical protein